MTRRALLDPLAPDERLSPEDMASRREEEDRADALAAHELRARGGVLIVRGVCTWCGQRCPPLAVYCDADCRSGHEADLARQARLCRPAGGR